MDGGVDRAGRRRLFFRANRGSKRGKGFAFSPPAMTAGLPEVYSLDEIARAAYVDAAAVESLVSRGRLPLVPGTRFVAETDAMAATRVLRHSALLSSQPVANDLFELAALGRGAMPRPGAWSAAVHLTVVLAILVLGRSAAPVGATESAPPTHLVFL